jgi:hypothetical protein
MKKLINVFVSRILRTNKILTLCILSGIVLSPSYAQRESGSYSIGFCESMGQAMLPENFKDYWGMGFGPGIEFKYNLTDVSCIITSFQFWNFNINNQKIIDMYEPLLHNISTLNTNNGAWRTMFLGLDIIHYMTKPDASIGLYIIGGGGYYLINEEHVDVVITTLEQSYKTKVKSKVIRSKFGFNGGFGFDMILNDKLFFFIQSKYHFIITEGLEAEDQKGLLEKAIGSVNSNTAFVSINAGLRFGLH